MRVRALSPSQQDEIDAEVMATVPGMLKKEGFRVFISRPAEGTTYWRHRDGRMALLTARGPDGRPKLQRLDR